MGMSVYNGSLYAGTLPLASVYRYDGNSKWTNTGNLDTTPDVRYRRAWSMAVFNGKLFCGVLPSGHIYSLNVGQNATYDKTLPAGWQTLTATRASDRVKLYLNGRLVATSDADSQSVDELCNGMPLLIGSGQHDYFNGKIKNLRIYNNALSELQIRRLLK